MENKKLLRGLEAEIRYNQIKNGESMEGFGYFYKDGQYIAFKIENNSLYSNSFDSKIIAHSWVYGK